MVRQKRKPDPQRPASRGDMREIPCEGCLLSTLSGRGDGDCFETDPLTKRCTHCWSHICVKLPNNSYFLWLVKKWYDELRDERNESVSSETPVQRLSPDRSIAQASVSPDDQNHAQ